MPANYAKVNRVGRHLFKISEFFTVVFWNINNKKKNKKKKQWRNAKNILTFAIILQRETIFTDR